MPNIENQTEKTENIETQVVEDPTKDLKKEMKENEEMEKLTEGDKGTVQPEKEEKQKPKNEDDIKKDMIDPNNPKKINGAYTKQKAFYTGKSGNTFSYEDVSKRAGDFEESVDDKKANTKEALQTIERVNQKEKEVEKKEKEVQLAMEEVPTEEDVPNPEDKNSIPEGEAEHEQITAVDTKHQEDVAALRKEEDDIDNETVEKLNTFAA